MSRLRLFLLLIHLIIFSQLLILLKYLFERGHVACGGDAKDLFYKVVRKDRCIPVVAQVVHFATEHGELVGGTVVFFQNIHLRLWWSLS